MRSPLQPRFLVFGPFGPTTNNENAYRKSIQEKRLRLAQNNETNQPLMISAMLSASFSGVQARMSMPTLRSFEAVALL
ncbi:hypothetical protein BH23PLA1_BH23PLA1_28790 [soil metagenome]